MSEVKKPLNFRIWSVSNSDFITRSYIEEINKDVLLFLRKSGINCKLLPPPELGGGEYISFFMKIIDFIKNFFQINAKKVFNSSAPRFKIYIYLKHNFDDDTIWKEEENIGRAINQLVFQAWNVNNHLSEQYKAYQYETEVNYHVPEFKYRLSVNLPYDQNTKIDFGYLMNYLSNFQLKGYIDEKIFVEKLLIKQHLTRLDKDERVIGTKLYRNIIYFKSKLFSSRLRGINESIFPKGKVIAPIPWL